jgi:hypothetical protein
MAGSNVQIGLNGSEIWAYIVELGDGLRMRLALDDWLRLNIGVGQQLPVRLPGKSDRWLFVKNATGLPPILWIVLTKRVRAEE